MTDPRDDLFAAMHRLRADIRQRVPMPAAAQLRARAKRRLRVRRTTTALVAAAAVAGLVLGGSTLLTAAAPPEPPAATTPAPHVGPTPAVPTTPSPRPRPRPAETIDDPIAGVDWKSATISVSAWEGCPGGLVSFVPVSDIVDTAIGPRDSYPAMLLDATRVAYGDLTGDGSPEAIMLASCVSSAESDPGVSHLLAFHRDDDGTLAAVGWAGPAGATYQSWWVAEQRLLVAVDAWMPDRGEDLVATVPGQVLAYGWEGERGLVGGDPAPEYPPIVPLDPTGTGPPVRPRAAVATGLGCPDHPVRFASSVDDREWRSLAPAGAGVMYGLPPQDGGHLVDLDRTNEPLLVVALSCLPTGGEPTHGLAVFERAGDGWQGISVLISPTGQPPGAWSMEGDRFTVEWRDGFPEAYRWSGTELIPVDD